MVGKPLGLGSMYLIIAGSDEDYMDFVKDKGIVQVSVYIHRIEQVKTMKTGTSIYKGYNYIESVTLDFDIMRKRIMLGDITFKDWIWG